MNALQCTHGVYEGQVLHARLVGRTHRFRYAAFMTALDLDTLEREGKLGVGTGLEPHGRFSLQRLRRRDHLGDPAVPLADAVRERVQQELPSAELGAVLMLSHLRQFGVGFNPVRFYFCFAADGTSLAAVLLEVHNTPWGEQHSYVLDCRGQQSPYEYRLPKQFTVSPFLPLDMDYRFRFELTDAQIRIHKDNYRGDERWFTAALVLRRTALDRATLLRAVTRHPLMTWKVLAGIYFEALRLWLKGVGFLGHQGGSPDRGSRATGPRHTTAPLPVASKTTEISTG